jgi:hypothetical protein
MSQFDSIDFFVNPELITDPPVLRRAAVGVPSAPPTQRRHRGDSRPVRCVPDLQLFWLMFRRSEEI